MKTRKKGKEVKVILKIILFAFALFNFILMLSTGTFENGEGVLERIRRRFRQDFRNREIIIYSNLQPLLPVEV